MCDGVAVTVAVALSQRPPISAISAHLLAALRRSDPACMRKWPRLRDLWRHRSGAIVWRQLAVRSKSLPALVASFAGPPLSSLQ